MLRDAFLTILLVALSFFVSAVALASEAESQTPILNTAHLAWSDGGIPRALDSNTVTIDVAAPPPSTLTAWKIDPTSTVRPTITASQCARADGGLQAIDVAAGGAGGTPLSMTREIHAGDPLVFQLVSRTANTDPARVDTMQAVLVTTAGDRETLTISETGADTGVFLGTMATRHGPPVSPGDCALSLQTGDTISIECQKTESEHPLADIAVQVLIDPYGLVFDSEDGAPLDGVRVTLVHADSGAPAPVFAEDGKTPWPASVVTGGAVQAGGVAYALPPGEYRFPLVYPGTYRLKVEPLAPYAAPSGATAAQLAALRRPDGGALIIGDGSYGAAFTLGDPAPVRIDIPLDRPAVAVAVSKTASTGQAQPGDFVRYTIVARNSDALHAKRGVVVTDTLPAAMRLRSDTIRLDGAPAPDAARVTADGRQVVVQLDTLAAGASRAISYALQVRADAPEGQALNRAEAVDARGTRGVASVAVKIERQTIGDRMTIVGRIVDAPCNATPPFANGVAGVRVMLEDGSYAISDADGRYHFEGVAAGGHVVQIDPATLVAGGRFVDCVRSSRAGRATSRFVAGQGGSLVTADFHAVLPAVRAQVTSDPAIPTPAGDKEAAGAERDWFAGGSAKAAWLFPESDHNPRAPAVRIAIRHLADQTIALTANGAPVDPVAFDGSRADPSGTWKVSLWRGVPLDGETTHFVASVRRADGRTVETLTRDVHFVATAAHAEFVAAKSRLVADGVTRPIVAVRITDRAGRPVHAGSVGDLTLSQPYVAAHAIDAEQSRQLAGLERAAPTWRVAGDDGIAYIALAPTTTSGALTLDFAFRDRDVVRRQQLDAWLSPGERPWTVVGLAEGRAGLGTLGDHLEPLDRTDQLIADGRVALYAKGRVAGLWLLTLAYDSAKKREEQRLSGQIDPNAYYTVYADTSERRFDAASTRKLYLKLEAPQFYALFGDFETNLNETELARYNRAATGLKAEYRGRRIAATAFAAKIATRHRRDEIQGNGLTGPYALAERNVLANSEQVVIEVRDRLRSENILERRSMTRFVDYDVDYAAGTLRFSSPVLSRTSALDPQFVVVDYEVDTLAGDAVNAGARARWTSAGGKVKLGGTVLSDADNEARTTIAAVDARVRLGVVTEARAEAALSRAAGATASALRAEIEHHDDRLDVLAYARQQDADYGVAQQNAAERGRRKLGVDARLRLSDALAISGSAWADDDLAGEARRRAARARLEYRTGRTDLHLGVVHASDTTAAGDLTSTLVEAGATQRLFGNRLELDAATSFALDRAASVDFPAQHRLGARFQFSQGIALTGAYEFARGDAIDARTARIGFDVKPWAGARLTSALAGQDIGEFGRRTYAAYGFAQSLQLGARWSIDATLDGNRTLSGIDAATLVNPAQPAASGGYLGSGRAITEDFTALTLGATFRAGAWSATGRGEYRFGSGGDRAGLTLGLIRRLGEGRVVGGLLTWTHATGTTGVTTGTLDAALSLALRPADSQVAMLGKLEWREDSVTGAIAGAPGPVGGATLTIDGDARSRRVLGSLSLDWAPYGRDEDGIFQRSELSAFFGARYIDMSFDAFDVVGLTALAGFDGRIGLGDQFEIGASATLRGDVSHGVFVWSAGPTIGIRPTDGALVAFGWNIGGFADRDFAAARATRDGFYLSLRLKFDQTDLSFLGLTR